MPTDPMDQMIHIGVPHEEIMFETGREQQNKLFMEGKRGDPSAMFSEHALFILIDGVPNDQLGV